VLLPQPDWGLITALGVLILQWGTVIFGVLYKSLVKKKNIKVSLAIYLVMGWTVVLVFPMFLRGATSGLFWFILAGGLCYSLGSVFYAVKKMKYQHMIWHLFVTAGAVCHLIGLSFFLH
jgi:hemolysin III